MLSRMNTLSLPGGSQAASHRSNRKETIAESMKEIQRERLHRTVYEAAEMAQRIAVIETSPVYNTRGEIIPTVSSTHIEV